MNENSKIICSPDPKAKKKNIGKNFSPGFPKKKSGY